MQILLTPTTHYLFDLSVLSLVCASSRLAQVQRKPNQNERPPYMPTNTQAQGMSGSTYSCVCISYNPSSGSSKGPLTWPQSRGLPGMRARGTKDRAGQREAISPGCKRKCAAVLNPPGSISSRGEDPRQTAQDAGDVEVDDCLAELSVVQLAVMQCPRLPALVSVRTIKDMV